MNVLTPGHILSSVWESWFQWLIDFKGKDLHQMRICLYFFNTFYFFTTYISSNDLYVQKFQGNEWSIFWKTFGFASGLETFAIQRDSIQLLLTPGRSRQDLPTGKAPVPSLFLKAKEHGKLGPVLWPLQPLPAFNCEESLYLGMEIQLIFAERQPAIISD